MSAKPDYRVQVFETAEWREKTKPSSDYTLQLYENLQYGGNLSTAKPDYGL